MVVIGGIAIGVKAIIAASAVLCIAFIILCYPALKTAIQEIRRSIQEFFKACKSGVLSIWRRKSKSAKPNIHHIIAKVDSRANRAREIVEKYMNVWTDERNLVAVKERFHQGLHNKDYFKAVNMCLEPASGNETKIFRVLASLKIILTVINTGA